MKLRFVLALVLCSFAAGAVFAIAATGGPTFAVLVRGADGHPQFLLDKEARPDFVYVGFPVGVGASNAAAHTAPVTGGAQVPTIACVSSKDRNCQHVASAAAPVGGTIICYPGECNPPTGVKYTDPRTQVGLTVSATQIATSGLTTVTVAAIVHETGSNTPSR